MTPEAFCASIQADLAMQSVNEAWVRGARALCELYRQTDAQRFDGILSDPAASTANSAVAAGERWLLARWHSANTLT
jgi:hypothetical protein